MKHRFRQKARDIRRGGRRSRAKSALAVVFVVFSALSFEGDYNEEDDVVMQAKARRLAREKRLDAARLQAGT